MCPVLLVHLGLKGKNSFMAHHWDECVRRISIGRHSHHHSNFEGEKKEFFFREATEAKKVGWLLMDNLWRPRQLGLEVNILLLFWRSLV